MASTAVVIPRLKDFKYIVEINGLEAALVQEFDPGVRTHGVTVHSSAGMNYVAKEVGMIGFSNCVLRTVVPAEGEGRNYWELWMNQGQDPTTGNGLLPKQYRRDFNVFELKPDGVPCRVWYYVQGFPVSLKTNAKSSLDDSTDVIEFVEIAYQYRTLNVL